VTAEFEGKTAQAATKHWTLGSQWFQGALPQFVTKRWQKPAAAPAGNFEGERG